MPEFHHEAHADPVVPDGEHKKVEEDWKDGYDDGERQTRGRVARLYPLGK